MHFCGDRFHVRQSRTAKAISDQNGLVRTEQYGYDELSRLTSVDGQTQTYTFDPMGNRTGKTDSVNGNDASTFNAANMLLTRNGQGYTYDANGNTLTGGGRTNSWDSANRLTQIVFNGTTTTHTYGSDGLRRRTVKGADTTDYILDGDSVIRTLQNGVLDKTYFHGLRGPEYERTGAGNPTWYVYDGPGSVVGLLEVNGSLVSTRKYDVYGSVRGGTGISGSKHKFVGSLGHPSEDDAGLIYMRARWMDPTTGTFTSEDPARDGGGWYAYAKNSPMDLCDRDGRSAEDVSIFAIETIYSCYCSGAFDVFDHDSDKLLKNLTQMKNLRADVRAIIAESASMIEGLDIDDPRAVLGQIKEYRMAMERIRNPIKIGSKAESARGNSASSMHVSSITAHDRFLF